eukprot:GFKZ01004989.1.p1 GENE.GFKZ01004989.1~~GFKZ01004989.1.p1  ORF type:complete len:756 (+),score=103.31 GFKZ01004989.1:232-2499(+)
MVRSRGERSRGIRKKRSAPQKEPRRTAHERAKNASQQHAFTLEQHGDISEDFSRTKDKPPLADDRDIQHESQLPESADKSVHAYQKLMSRIRASQPTPSNNTPKRNRKAMRTASKTSGQRGGHSPIQESDDDDTLRAFLGVQNAAATARENTHFALVSSGEDSPSPQVKPSCVAVQGARVFTNLPPTLEEEVKHQVKDCTDPKTLGLPPNMYFKWRQLQPISGPAKVDDIENVVIGAVRDYRDLFLAYRLTAPEETRIRQLLAAHCLAHALRARRRVVRNDNAMRSNLEMESPKDQGFARPRVLILAPMRNAAYDTVETILKLAVPESDTSQEYQIANHDRFKKEFAPDDVDTDAVDNDIEAKAAATTLKKPTAKPLDHRHAFRGNIDDDFKFGISFTKKTVRLYSDFYDSDVIIASPLGLLRRNAEKARNPGGSKRHREEDDGETEWKVGISAAERKKAPDPDDDGFLSSIEICVVDGAHIFSMQNWDSVVRVMAMVNKMPTNTRDTDFSRVREWCLNGDMQRYRQTILLSHYRKSEFLSLMRSFNNHAGRFDVIQTPPHHGTMSDVIISIRQTFLKVPDVSSPLAATEKRLDFFFNSTLPMLRNLSDTRCLIFVPSYFDFVRVRNRFLRMSQEDSSFQFASMCEYSKGADVSRARGRLYDGSVPFVLVTERFHFFWRHWLRGARNIVWYGLPENALFYPEILNMTAEAAEMGSSVQSVAIYDITDQFRLQTIVGQERCRMMTAGNSSLKFLFC